MRIAVCDDEKQCRDQTVSAIRECLKGMDYGVDSFAGGTEFLQAFSKKPYDLVFFDIEMPEIDGITLAKKLRKIHKDVPIIFLTSHIEYALEGYEVNALRYLTKPVDIEKLRSVLSVVADRMQQLRTLWIKTDLSEHKIALSDVLYMESQNQNILICTTTEAYSVRHNMADYEEDLGPDGFFRTHRGYLVSLAHVKSVGKGELTLDDGTQLPVSRSKEKELKEALFEYTRREAI